MADGQDNVVCEVTILNRQGLHARPVMRFVDLAQSFSAEIKVEALKDGGVRVDGKSAMDMMLLGATCGTSLRISASGTDAARAAEALSKLVNNHFGTEEAD